MTTQDPTPCLVITGASRGIGFATAERFLTAGYRVINISRTAAPNPDIVQLEADLFDPAWGEAVAADLNSLVDGASKIVLVHNAALQAHGGVDQLDAQTLRKVMELNVIAPTILNQLLLPAMKAGSSIIYIGSTLSLKATANVAAYVTSKHALLGLMRSTCQDLGGRGIHTACVCPGFTDTEMLRSYGGEVLEQLAQASTIGRLVQPQEIAESIWFCASNPAVNGTYLRADLGLIEH
ncbi:SDR family NAD(P)-dependent oxidoreductase [Dasania marina]|uniref:SDR family NAD(P)-dependent oxidoreductase n=1 Tax=Dasania marina TaxID=471499 RepID=UPI0003820A25|nr:SDR family oxidoreductase [Dasania marina]